MRRRSDLERIDAELSLLGTPKARKDLSLRSIYFKTQISIATLSRHRTRCLGLPALPVGRSKGRRAEQHVPPRSKAPPADEPCRVVKSVSKGTSLQRRDPKPPKEETAQELIRVCSAMLALATWQGAKSVASLAERHGTSEEEVRRCHRVAAERVEAGRGGQRAQCELSVAVLSQIRDQERDVSRRFGRLAEDIGDGALGARGRASEDRQDARRERAKELDDEELRRMAVARGVAAQASSNAIAAQRQIDQITVLRKRTVKISFSAAPELGALCAAIADLVGRIGEIHGVDDLRTKVDGALAALEDGGDEALAEYLAEMRADRLAFVTEGRAA